jgi:hypothetical protein
MPMDMMRQGWSLKEAMVMLEAMSEHLRLESGLLEAHCQPVDLATIFASLAL